MRETPNNSSRWDDERVIWEFESRWRGESPPELDDFVSEFRSSVTAEIVVELCRVDLEHRLRRGIAVNADRYPSQFPESFAEAGVRDDFRQWAAQWQSQWEGAPGQIRGAVTDPKESHSGIENLSAGDEVDQYIIVAAIGRGAFSRVYEAKDTSLGRHVALKFLQLQQESPLRQRLLREAHAVAMLDHPGIVPVYSVGNWRGIDYIASRLVPGQSLDDYLAENSLPARQSAEIVHDLALAVDHAHQMGIVHRDIKPANVMIDSGHPLLVDFGLAYWANDDSSRLTIAGEVIGTPSYMAPEQALGRSFMADGRSDIYSLGVLLYRMLCDRVPFEGSTQEVISQVIHREATMPRRLVRPIDRDLETIVLKCLEKEAHARYPSAELLASDLKRFLEGKPILARRTGPFGRAVRWARRRPIAATVLVGLALIVAALGGALSQLQTVRQQRDRAVIAESAANQARAETAYQLAQTAAKAGQLANQRGRWGAALQHFDRALKGLPADESVPIQWQRIATLVSMRRIEEALDALSDVIARPHATDSVDAGTPLYWQAELELEREPGGERCESLFEQALAAGLAPADHWYAKGMLATNTEQAIDCFRAALAVDPFHHRARRESMLLLITLARLEEAVGEAVVGRQLFPEDADFVLLESIARALGGHRSRAVALLPAQQLTLAELERWRGLIDFLDRIPRDLQVFPDTDQFDQRQLRQVSREFQESILPLLGSRGWHFPPRIARMFADLPELLVAWSDPSTADGQGDAGARLSARLHELAKIHAEATLLLLGSYVDFVRLQIGSDDLAHLSSEQIQGLEQMRENYRRCLDRGFLLQIDREEIWKAIYLASMLLARFAQQDVQHNTDCFVEALEQMDVRSPVHRDYLRTYVLTLIEAGALEPAKKWATQWVRVTDRQDSDAMWHLMIIAQRQQDWLQLERLGREACLTFPDQQPMRDFYNGAIHEIQRIIDESSIEIPAAGDGVSGQSPPDSG